VQRTIDEAIDILAASPYGNAASIFTSSGAAARKFRYEVRISVKMSRVFGRREQPREGRVRRVIM